MVFKTMGESLDDCSTTSVMDRSIGLSSVAIALLIFDRICFEKILFKSHILNFIDIIMFDFYTTKIMDISDKLFTTNMTICSKNRPNYN